MEIVDARVWRDVVDSRHGDDSTRRCNQGQKRTCWAHAEIIVDDGRLERVAVAHFRMLLGSFL